MSDETIPTPPAGWYDDPAHPGQRYWTGTEWASYGPTPTLPTAAPQNAIGNWAFALGLVALLLFWFPILFLLTSVAGGIVAIVLAVRARRLGAAGLASNRALATAGLVLGIVGLVLAGCNMLIGAVVGAINAVS